MFRVGGKAWVVALTCLFDAFVTGAWILIVTRIACVVALIRRLVTFFSAVAEQSVVRAGWGSLVAYIILLEAVLGTVAEQSVIRRAGVAGMFGT